MNTKMLLNFEKKALKYRESREGATNKPLRIITIYQFKL